MLDKLVSKIKESFCENQLVFVKHLFNQRLQQVPANGNSCNIITEMFSVAFHFYLRSILIESWQFKFLIN